MQVEDAELCETRRLACEVTDHINRAAFVAKEIPLTGHFSTVAVVESALGVVALVLAKAVKEHMYEASSLALLAV